MEEHAAPTAPRGQRYRAVNQVTHIQSQSYFSAILTFVGREWFRWSYPTRALVHLVAHDCVPSPLLLLLLYLSLARYVHAIVTWQFYHVSLPFYSILYSHLSHTLPTQSLEPFLSLHKLYIPLTSFDEVFFRPMNTTLLVYVRMYVCMYVCINE